MLCNTNSHKHDSQLQFQIKLCDTIRFRNVMKATILKLYVLLGLKWIAILKWQAIVKHELPHLLHFFTLGKWVQLKHKLITAVAFS